jgi:hypothetical protein
MKTLAQITHEAFTSTVRFPRRWILALVQVIAFSVVGELGRSHWLRPVFVSYLLLSACVLGPITTWLWLEIEDSTLKFSKALSIKSFTQSCLTSAGIIFSSIIAALLVRFIYMDWIFLAVVSSLIASTAALAMLYAVLFRQSFYRSVVLAADTWNKKISLAAESAFVLILGHGASYAIVHGLFGNMPLIGGFSVFSHSATIWILLLVLIFLAAFIGAFFNCFLVFLFLETIKREKDSESEKQAVAKLEVLEARH